MVLLMANNSAVRTPPENLEEFLYSSQHLRREALAFRETKKKQMTDAEMQEKREFRPIICDHLPASFRCVVSQACCS